MPDPEQPEAHKQERRWRMFFRRHGLRILVGLAGIGALWFGFNLWRVTTFDWQTEGKGEAALVLGGITRRGQLSDNFRERINHAIHLYREGRVGLLIMTGGKPSWEPASLAEAAASYARSNGIPDQHIVLESHSQTTIENFVFSARVMEERGIKSCLIVSDPLHLCRASIIARDNGLDAAPSGTPSTTIVGWWAKACFALREARLLSAYPVMRHAQGSLAYDITKRISTGFED